MEKKWKKTILSSRQVAREAYGRKGEIAQEKRDPVFGYCLPSALLARVLHSTIHRGFRTTVSFEPESISLANELVLCAITMILIYSLFIVH